MRHRVIRGGRVGVKWRPSWIRRRDVIDSKTTPILLWTNSECIIPLKSALAKSERTIPLKSIDKQ